MLYCSLIHLNYYYSFYNRYTNTIGNEIQLLEVNKLEELQNFSSKHQLVIFLRSKLLRLLKFSIFSKEKHMY
jgi:hypothetical protein